MKVIQKADLITDYYADQNRQVHARERWGESGRKYAKEVLKFYREINAKSILDYGCGCRTLEERLKQMGENIPVCNYDPALPGFDMLPPRADLLVCTDVMEHVEPDKIQVVIDHIFDLSILGAYIVIATRPCERFLPDGRGCHLTVKGPEFWLPLFEKWPHIEHKLHKDSQSPTGLKKITLWLKK